MDTKAAATVVDHDLMRRITARYAKEVTALRAVVSNAVKGVPVVPSSGSAGRSSPGISVRSLTNPGMSLEVVLSSLRLAGENPRAHTARVMVGVGFREIHLCVRAYHRYAATGVSTPPREACAWAGAIFHTRSESAYCQGDLRNLTLHQAGAVHYALYLDRQYRPCVPPQAVAHTVHHRLICEPT
ncbi:hypothetical protein R3Q06_36185, partial [Rhodococcus erythropolis]|uniref:hypothetical protein n=1 Tax=Rhodococcus erythropolis TaxID=1833 RepID=UPI002949D506